MAKDVHKMSCHHTHMTHILVLSIKVIGYSKQFQEYNEVEAFDRGSAGLNLFFLNKPSLIKALKRGVQVTAG